MDRECAHTRILRRVHEVAQQLDFPNLASDQVLLRKVPVDRNVTPPAIWVTPVGQEQLRDGDFECFDRGYPVTVFFESGAGEPQDLELSDDELSWRKLLLDRFDGQALTVAEGDVYECVAEPGPIYDLAAWRESQLCVGSITLRFFATELTGIEPSRASTLFEDLFTNANGTALATHNALWTVHAGAVEIDANSARVVTAPGKATMAVGEPNVILEADVTGYFTDAGNYSIPALLVRVSADFADFYEWDLDLTTGGGRLLFNRVTAGAYTIVNSSVLTLTSGVTYRLKLECLGGLIRGWIDGDLRLSAPIPQGPTNSRAGFLFAKAGTPSSGARVDNFRVTAA